ncbi:MAG: competence/damage-inducible protein A [Eubacteriales bacterium]|jgi:nicotinamide-nucleotide amidase
MAKSVEIIAVGTELLLGDIVNTNAQYIAQGLSRIGIHVYFQTVVGDNPQRLTQCLELAKSRADILLTTGGLGPTYDDLTKETIAAAFGRKLVLDEESLETIRQFFAGLGRPMTPNNEKQAMMPEGCIILKNPNGTAPGCIIEGDDGKIAIMMPGPPREMKPMFDDQVLPYLQRFSTEHILSKTLRVVGVGESAIEDILKPMMVKYENPTIAPYAKDAECLLRVTARVHDPAEADALIDPVIEEITPLLGDGVYGIDIPSLEYHLVQLLREKGKTVAFAESCTGGLCSKRITDIPGSSDVLGMGVVTYSNAAKQQLLGVRSSTLERYGAVSRECAIEMARGCKALSGADVAVGITGIAGPGGGTPEKPVGLVYVAITDGRRTWCRKLLYPRSRDYVRTVTATNAFDMVRKFLLHPQTGEKEEG